MKGKGYDAMRAERELKAIKHLNEGQSTGMLTGPLDKQEAIRKAREIADEQKRKYIDARDRLTPTKK